MERKTKKCPYCGEEILETASKCRYCRSWLVPHEGELPSITANPVESEPEKPELAVENLSSKEEEVDLGDEELAEDPEEEEMDDDLDDTDDEEEDTDADDNLDTDESLDLDDLDLEVPIDTDSPEYKFIMALPFEGGLTNVFFWIAVIGCACTAYHYYVGDDPIHSNYVVDKAYLISVVLSWIPDWLGVLMQCVGACMLFYILRGGLRAITPTIDKWLTACIVLQILFQFGPILWGTDNDLDISITLLWALTLIWTGVKIKNIDGFGFIGWSLIISPILRVACYMLSEDMGTDSELGFLLEFSIASIIAPCVPYYAIKDKCN